MGLRPGGKAEGDIGWTEDEGRVMKTGIASLCLIM
jgi:hypothetical protein